MVDKKYEILTEILIGLKLDENINLPNYSKNIFKNQDIKHINERHRSVVIEWLSYVNHHFNQSNETLFLLWAERNPAHTCPKLPPPQIVIFISFFCI